MPEPSRIVCPHCGALNRVPAERPARAAKCGACHVALFAGAPAEVDEAGLERHLREDSIPLLLDVWAPWCGPCRAMAPAFARAAAVLEPQVRLLKLNADTAPQVTARLERARHPGDVSAARRPRDRADRRRHGHRRDHVLGPPQPSRRVWTRGLVQRR